MVQRLQSEPLPLVRFVSIGCLWSAVQWFRDGGPALQQHCWLMDRRHWLGLIRMDRHRPRASMPRRIVIPRLSQTGHQVQSGGHS